MTGPLRIGWNLSWLRPGEVGGTETYARRLFEALHCFPQHIDGAIIEYLGIGTEQALDTLDPAKDRFGLRLTQRSRSPVIRVIEERTSLPRRVRHVSPSIVHHLGGTAPESGDARTIVTIHDLQPLEFPENFSPLKRAFLARALPAAAQRADLVITPSHYVADRVKDRFQIADERVTTVSVWAHGEGHGIDELAIDTSPYLLYPAMTAPHKNHAVLFESFRLAREKRRDLRLVCTGTRGSLHDEIARHAAQIDGIELRGLLPATAFRSLVSAAEAVVYPSRFEGFGLPIIEAQASRTVVYASSATCLPEIMGYEGRLIDPDDVEGWAEAMMHPLEGKERSEEIARGVSNAGRYSREATAKDQFEAYERVLNG